MSSLYSNTVKTQIDVLFDLTKGFRRNIEKLNEEVKNIKDKLNNNPVSRYNNSIYSGTFANPPNNRIYNGTFANTPASTRRGWLWGGSKKKTRKNKNKNKK